MVAIAIGISVTHVLRNHCYRVGNKSFHQNNDKGVIGLDLQRSVARVYMINWAKKLIKLCEEITANSPAGINIKPDFFNIYVDDSLGAFVALPKGIKYCHEKRCLEIDQAIDNENDKSKEDRRTCDIIVEIANTIDKDIRMTSEVPSDYDETTGKVPFLDTQLWVDRSNSAQVLY